MVTTVERQGHRGFVDVTAEGSPEEESRVPPVDGAELARPAQPPDTAPGDAGPPLVAGSRGSSRRPS
eukprot:10729546-Alexandrium_andersonii.AAC.1